MNTPKRIIVVTGSNRAFCFEIWRQSAGSDGGRAERLGGQRNPDRHWCGAIADGHANRVNLRARFSEGLVFRNGARFANRLKFSVLSRVRLIKEMYPPGKSRRGLRTVESGKTLPCGAYDRTAVIGFNFQPHSTITTKEKDKDH
jgi:hypothetical protein